jgi:hypothetical protein
VDLAISKLLAGRPKDIEFVRQMLRLRLVTEPAIMGMLGELAPEDSATAEGYLRSAVPAN